MALPFFIMVFCYISIVNFSLFGPGRGPPHKGGRKGHFFEEFTIRDELLHKLCEFLTFSGPSWRGRWASLKIKAKQRKALQGIAKPTIAKHGDAYASHSIARHSKTERSKA